MENAITVTNKQVYRSTKTYGHEAGLSCAFRQWRATHSLCHYLHGYALSFKFVFACSSLDDKSWCCDFGNLQDLKAELKCDFDHKTAVAADDPMLPHFQILEDVGLMQLTIFPNVGCEAFAYEGWKMADRIIHAKYPEGRVWVESCEVAEHGANSAIYTVEPLA